MKRHGHLFLDPTTPIEQVDAVCLSNEMKLHRHGIHTLEALIEQDPDHLLVKVCISSWLARWVAEARRALNKKPPRRRR